MRQLRKRRYDKYQIFMIGMIFGILVTVAAVIFVLSHVSI